jgi:hypothetical protein
MKNAPASQNRVSSWSTRKGVEDVSLLKNKKEFVIIGTSLRVRRTDERAQIAEAVRQRVMREHTYDHQDKRNT